jgi:hypothetical protein
VHLDLLVKDPVISGGLALFPVFSTSPAAPHYLTGPEADTGKLLTVGELEDGASVPTLLVENHGTEPVLLVEGETLVGARQNRTLNVSVLVGAGTKIEIPVVCVEAGRWGEARPMGRSGHHAPTDLRRVKSETVNLARAGDSVRTPIRVRSGIACTTTRRRSARRRRPARSTTCSST